MDTNDSAKKSLTGFRNVSPQTDFVQKEYEILEKWYKNGIVDKYLHKNDKSSRKFSFLDGPITANNPMGVHHGWGRTYKDFWQRFWNMRGMRQRFQNGFDEQGLWVEVEVEKELGLKSKKDIENLVSNDKFASLAKFINLCKARVAKFSKIQTEQSKRLGYFMDWDNSYHTSSDENNYAIWNFLKVVDGKGWLYKGHDSVPWCPRCGTAISQHEILTEEYKELTHESVFFKLPIRGRKGEYLLAWTTTPWTIPSNVAVAINKKEKYCAYQSGSETLWVMDKRIKELEKQKILSGGKSIKSIKGKDLIGWEYDGPFDDLPLVKKTLEDYVHRVIDGEDIVTEEEGTGLLHVAPGAGEEDFKLGKQNKIPVISTIEEDASYLEEMGKFSGQNAKWHPELIIDELKSKDGGKYLLTTQMYKHRYPTCWRCKTELVWRVVDEWYISMDTPSKSKISAKGGSASGGKNQKSKIDEGTFREQMVEVAKKIKWMPEWGLERELDWLRNMHDWLISKKRYWGLALPIYECKKCGHFDVIGSKKELKDRSAGGWEKFENNSPHRPWVDEVKIKCSNCGEIMSRIPDVGNPWLDAGIVPYSTMPQDFRPADFITESFPGQFKNWFYSLIAMSTALEGKNAFKTVLGFASVRDEHGDEMHKSKGNAIEFNEAADKIGVDVMRWLYLRQNPEYNLNFGYHTADEVRKQFILRLWNVYSFFVTYANLNKFKPVKGYVPSENILDQWIISRLNESIKNVTKYIENYNAHKATEDIENFVINDLSNWYVRRSRERVNPSSVDEKDRQWALQTLWWVLNEYSRLLAPFIPFIAEEIYTNITNSDSVHLADWPEFDQKLINLDIQYKMDLAKKLSEEGHAQRKLNEIKVRQPLSSLSTVSPVDFSDLKILVQDEVNVKDVLIKVDAAKLKVDLKDPRIMDTKLDTKRTPQLIAEGEARDIVRKIQEERKKIGTKLDERVNVALPAWPKEFEEDIKRKALVNNLTKGDFSVSKS
ncbi:MAG: isoleucine--tRNA ligase [Candidatus Levybacteria bacterium]|nr:isoleucine--tRNA ligase [Candidatus Levybacteria bacterium]